MRVIFLSDLSHVFCLGLLTLSLITSLDTAYGFHHSGLQRSSRKILFHQRAIRQILPLHASALYSPTTLFVTANRKNPSLSADHNPSPFKTRGSQQSYLEFIYPQTNTSVILIGCLHGSSSSAKDVDQILRNSCTVKKQKNDDLLDQDTYTTKNAKTHTNVVVLELCASRYADMQRELTLRRTSCAITSSTVDRAALPLTKKTNKLSSFLSMVSRTIRSRGLSTGLAAAILGGAAGVQTALSGFEPGLEFVTAIDYVASTIPEPKTDSNLGNRSPDLPISMTSCDVVLADQTVDETLRRVGTLPSVSIGMVKEFVDSGLDWEKTYGVESNRLSNAIWGDIEWMMKMQEIRDCDGERQDGVKVSTYLQVDMGRVLIRSREVIMDLVRLTLPPLLLIEAITTCLNTIFDSVVSITSGAPLLQGNNDVPNEFDAFLSSWTVLFDMTSSLTGSDWMAITQDFIFEVAISAIILFVGYVLIALPASRLILFERDEQLATGIRAACQIASEKQKNIHPVRKDQVVAGGRVVAVLGLLHVNGVARFLLGEEFSGIKK